MNLSTQAWLLLLLPLATAALIFFVLKRSANVSALVATASSAVLFLTAVALARGDAEGAEIASYSWMYLGDQFDIRIGLLVDELSQGMMLIVTLVGLLVHLFSLAYMKDDAGKARYFAALSLFLFSMTGIVLADNFVMMFIFWELVGVSSYLLIGHWYQKTSAAEAAKKAFLTNRIGDFGFMIGILLVWTLVGSVTFSTIAAQAGEVTNLSLLNIAVICVFCGAIGKSAQLPLHVWLPDAMEGPTPVSALIHAATMVAAGVFLLARIGFLIEMTELAAQVILWVGAITALVAALMATQQNDIKRILAYSTLSQLGYMVMAQGVAHGGSDAGMFHLYTHAFFKALLFLGSGAVIYACHHQQDIWKMGGLRKSMPTTFFTFALGTAALIAVPLTSGFWSKEAILETTLHEGHIGPYILAMIVAFLTPFYMTRLFIVAFFGDPRTHDAEKADEVGPLMIFPLITLAVFAVFSAYDPFAAWFKARGHADFGHLVSHFGMTAILSILGLIVGVAGAIFLYRGRDTDPINIRLFARKFYLDEIYIGLVRIFQDAVAHACNMFDRFIWAPLVTKVPALGALTAGGTMRVFQTGNVQSYAFFFGFAILALVLFLIL